MKLYFKFIWINIASQMQYKTSFFMAVLGQFVFAFTGIISIYFIFDRFDSVDGYTMSEVLLCYAIVFIAFTVSEAFFRGFDTFPGMIRTGNLDRLLVRPHSVGFQTLASNFRTDRLGMFLQAVCVFVYALATIDVVWTLDKVITVVLMVIGGIATYAGLFILYAGFSFFTIEGLEFMNIFVNGSGEFGKYPFAIYGERVLKFLTFIVPFALFQYYPFTYLIGRSDNQFFIITPLFCFIFIIPCYIFFKYGLSKYQSSGS